MVPFSATTRQEFSPDPAGILAAAGIPFSRSGRSLRIAAIWRGGDGPSVAVDATSGAWFDHARGEGGGWNRLCALLGIDGTTQIATPIDRSAADAAAAAADREAVATARRICGEGKLLSGVAAWHREIARKYFAARGLDVDDLPRSTVKYRATTAGVDLIFPIRTTAVDLTAVSVLSLDTDGTKVDREGGARKTHGRKPAGSHFLLPRNPRRDTKYPNVILICEGVETAMAAQAITGSNAVAAIDARGLARLLDDDAFASAVRGQTLLACADRDISGTGQRAAAALVRAARDRGIDAKYAEPPAFVSGGPKGADWNDVLLHFADDPEGGAAAFEAALLIGEQILGTIPAAGETPVAEYVAPEGAMTMKEAATAISAAVTDFIDLTDGGMSMMIAQTGLGKSHAFSRAIESRAEDGGAVAILTPTTQLAEEAENRTQALTRRHGRSGDETDAGYCRIYPDISPYGERWRSIVAQKCQSCIFGKAAMEQIKGEDRITDAPPCEYILHQAEVRAAAAVVATAAAYDGDPSLSHGSGHIERAIIADDCAHLFIEKQIGVADIAQWSVALALSIDLDRAAIDRGAIYEDAEVIEQRIAASKLLGPQIDRLAAAAAAQLGEQTKIAVDDFRDFIIAARASAIDVLDGTTAERVFYDEGRTVIPLRAIRALADAIEGGRAWTRHGAIIISTPTRVANDCVENKRIMVADATPSLALIGIAEAHHAPIIRAEIATPHLAVETIHAGAGKTACDPTTPSGQRAMEQLMMLARDAVRAHGRDRAAILTHMHIAQVLRKYAESDPTLPAPENIGWYGRHDRGHNDWIGVTVLVIYGAPALSPSAAERMYEAERGLLAQVGVTWPAWSGARAKDEDGTERYADPHIREWAADWSAARVAQGIGRLRASRRPDETLRVTFVGTLDIHGRHGIQVRRTIRPPWRDHARRRADEQASQIARAAFAAALGGDSVREVRAILHEHGFDGLANADAARLLASVPSRECLSFATRNTCASLDALIGAIPEHLLDLSTPAAAIRSLDLALATGLSPAMAATATAFRTALAAIPPPDDD